MMKSAHREYSEKVYNKEKKRMIKLPIVEVSLTGISLWWAFVLLIRNDFFDLGFIPAGATNPGIFILEAIGSVDEVVWSITFIIAATTKVIGLFTMNTLTRKIGIIFSIILYSLICTGYILSGNFLFPSTGVYFILTVMAWWAFREVKNE